MSTELRTFIEQHAEGWLTRPLDQDEIDALLAFLPPGIDGVIVCDYCNATIHRFTELKSRAPKRIT